VGGSGTGGLFGRIFENYMAGNEDYLKSLVSLHSALHSLLEFQIIIIKHTEL